MHKIYEHADTVLIWLGPDDENQQAALAIDSVRQITAYQCDEMSVSMGDLASVEEVYHNIIFKNRHLIPAPQDCELITRDMWESLLWLHKHPYFTRLWVVQEINANKHRLTHCGHEIIPWDAIELVAGYIILEPPLSEHYDFSKSFCWWTSTASSELRQARNWLHMLYLASNFASTDPRDLVFGLRGMINCREGGSWLDPDYSKTTLEVYRDTVEASLIDSKKPNALLYVSGEDLTSWVPRWDHPMLFRNPFRFGKPLPWKPAGETQAVWSIDRDAQRLVLVGV